MVLNVKTRRQHAWKCRGKCKRFCAAHNLKTERGGLPARVVSTG